MPSRIEKIQSQQDYRAECRFWDSPQNWMFDAPTHAFLARAVNRIGAALHSDWSHAGEKPHAEALEQRRSIRDRIREECAFGRLVAAYQGPYGDFAELPSHRWNNLDYRAWFKDCTISSPEVTPHHHPLATVLHHPLFVTRKSLERLLARIDTPEKPQPSPKNYSVPKVMEWAQHIFDEAEAQGKENYIRDDFVEAAQKQFPGLRVDWVRRNIWSKRPSVYPRRVRDG